MLRVRTDPAGEPLAVPPEELLDGRVAVSARTEVETALGFVPLPRALASDVDVRTRLARAAPVPSLRGHDRVRLVTAVLAAFPVLRVLDLDRHVGASAVVSDLVLAAFAGRELARPTPHASRVAAACLFAIAVRLAGAILATCARGTAIATWIAVVLAVFAGAIWLARAPSAFRVALELGGKLGLDRRDLTIAHEGGSSGALGGAPRGRVATALVATVGAWLAVKATRHAGLGPEVELAVLVACGAVIPLVVRRASGSHAPHAPRVPRVVASGAALGLAAALAFAWGGGAFMDAGDALARCADKLDAESRRAIAAHTQEVAQALARLRGSPVLAATALVGLPFVSERIFRGLLLPVLVDRYGRAYGLFATSVVFAALHPSPFALASWQVAAAGVAFGLAFFEGGVVAAFVAHALFAGALLL